MQLTAQQKKTAKIVLISLTAGVLGYLIYQSSTKVTIPGIDPTQSPQDNSNFDAQGIADGLEQAMLSWLGTDENAIQKLLGTVTAAQFKLVDKAFGLRGYNTFTGFSTFGSLQPLKVWLKSELSSSDYNALKLKYPQSL
jgi:hypothetical protein